jgi:hypothetical protein
MYPVNLEYPCTLKVTALPLVVFGVGVGGFVVPARQVLLM